MAAHTVYCQVMGMFLSHQKYSAPSIIQGYGWERGGGVCTDEKHTATNKTYNFKSLLYTQYIHSLEMST